MSTYSVGQPPVDVDLDEEEDEDEEDDVSVVLSKQLPPVSDAQQG